MIHPPGDVRGRRRPTVERTTASRIFRQESRSLADSVNAGWKYPRHRRRFYRDPNLNGCADDDGTLLSLASLRANPLTSQDIHRVSSTRFRDGPSSRSPNCCRSTPFESYSLNNRLLYRGACRRFGPVTRWDPWLIRLPSNVVRLLDDLSGDRDWQLVVDGRLDHEDEGKNVDAWRDQLRGPACVPA